MAIGRTLEEAFKKALRSVDTDVTVHTNPSEIRMILSRPTDERFACLFDAFRQGFTVEEIHTLTKITPFFLEKIKNIVEMEQALAVNASIEDIRRAKIFGFSNLELKELTGKSWKETGKNYWFSDLQDGRYLCRRIPCNDSLFLFDVGYRERNNP